MSSKFDHGSMSDSDHRGETTMAPDANKENTEMVIRELRSQETYQHFLESIPDSLIGQDPKKIEGIKKMLDRANKEFEQNPDLAKTYDAIFLQHDRRALHDHSKKRLEAIKKMWNWSVRMIDVDSNNLAAFETFVRDMEVVRSDKDAASIDVYRSPRETGQTASFGPQDILVQADRYVYASLDEMKHFMARAKNTDVLDAPSFEDRAELVMQDIANLSARHPDQLVETYMNNVFDLKTGKEILSHYLALVFKSPDEARSFFDANNQPASAQRWDSDLHISIPIQEIPFLPSDTPETFMQKMNDTENAASERTREIVAMMKKIAAQTGFEPPLSLEVRIPDFAPKKSNL